MRIAEANLKPKILSEVFFVFPTAQGEGKPRTTWCVQKIFSWQSFIGKICLWLLNFN